MKKLKVMIMTLMMCLVGINFYSCEKNDISKNYVYGTVTDIDGNVYKTVTIGTQTWMAENLRVTRYISIYNNDTCEIQNDMVDSIWTWHTTFWPTLCYYENDSSNNKIYGILYNHLAAEMNIAPEGWRVPNNEDWKILIKYLENNPSPKNIKDFTNGSCGFREGITGKFSLGDYNYWWSTSGTMSNSDPYYPGHYIEDYDKASFCMVNTSYFMSIYNTDRKNGLAIRCIKNN